MKNIKFYLYIVLKIFVAMVVATLPLSMLMLFVQKSSEIVRASVIIGVFVAFYLYIYDLFFTRRQNRAFIDRTKPEDMAEASRNYFMEYTLRETLVHAVILIPIEAIAFFAWRSSGKLDYASIATVVVVVLFPLVSYCASKRRIDKEAKKIIEVLEMRKRNSDYRRNNF